MVSTLLFFGTRHVAQNLCPKCKTPVAAGKACPKCRHASHPDRSRAAVLIAVPVGPRDLSTSSPGAIERVNPIKACLRLVVQGVVAAIFHIRYFCELAFAKLLLSIDSLLANDKGRRPAVSGRDSTTIPSDAWIDVAYWKQRATLAGTRLKLQWAGHRKQLLAGYATIAICFALLIVNAFPSPSGARAGALVSANDQLHGTAPLNARASATYQFWLDMNATISGNMAKLKDDGSNRSQVARAIAAALSAMPTQDVDPEAVAIALDAVQAFRELDSVESRFEAPEEALRFLVGAYSAGQRGDLDYSFRETVDARKTAVNRLKQFEQNYLLSRASLTNRYAREFPNGFAK